MMSMAEALGFITTQPGGNAGQPSPPQLLEAIAAAYAANPAAVTAALRSLGIAP